MVLNFYNSKKEGITSSSNCLDCPNSKSIFPRLKNNFYLFLHRINKKSVGISYLIICYIGVSETIYISRGRYAQQSCDAADRKIEYSLARSMLERWNRSRIFSVYFPTVTLSLRNCENKSSPNGDKNHWNSHLSTLYNCDIL